MKRSLPRAIMSTVILAVSLMAVGCAKKSTVVPPEPPPTPPQTTQTPPPETQKPPEATTPPSKTGC